MQCTWAEVGAEIGLSESMIYQVKSGARKLSPKAEYRLAIAERKVGLAPAIDPILNKSTTPTEAAEIFARASTSEQLEILERDTGFWRFWFEMSLVGLKADFLQHNKRSVELARLAKDFAKKTDDEALMNEMLAIAKAILANEKEVDFSISDTIQGIVEAVDRRFRKGKLPAE